MLRVFLIIGTIATHGDSNITHNAVYTASAWAGVLVSLVFGEWFILQRTLGPLVQLAEPPTNTPPTVPDAAALREPS